MSFKVGYSFYRTLEKLKRIIKFIITACYILLIKHSHYMFHVIYFILLKHLDFFKPLKIAFGYHNQTKLAQIQLESESL